MYLSFGLGEAGETGEDVGDDEIGCESSLTGLSLVWHSETTGVSFTRVALIGMGVAMVVAFFVVVVVVVVEKEEGLT